MALVAKAKSAVNVQKCALEYFLSRSVYNVHACAVEYHQVTDKAQM